MTQSGYSILTAEKLSLQTPQKYSTTRLCLSILRPDSRKFHDGNAAKVQYESSSAPQYAFSLQPPYKKLL